MIATDFIESKLCQRRERRKRLTTTGRFVWQAWLAAAGYNHEIFLGTASWFDYNTRTPF
jgi:hypothetical protein